MANIFDDPAQPGAATPDPKDPKPATPVVIQNTADPEPKPKADKKPMPVGCLVRFLLGILALIVIVGTLGFTYPGSSLVDPIFGAVGSFVLKTVFQGNSINFGYGIVAWSAILILLARWSKK